MRAYAFHNPGQNCTARKCMQSILRILVRTLAQDMKGHKLSTCVVKRSKIKFIFGFAQRVELVKKLAQPIIKESGLTKLDWEIIVVDKNVANAFVLPGKSLSPLLI